jgi:hypothetical protein
MQQLKNSTRKRKLKSEGTHSVRVSNITGTLDLSIDTKNHMCKFPKTVPLKTSDCVINTVRTQRRDSHL